MALPHSQNHFKVGDVIKHCSCGTCLILTMKSTPDHNHFDLISETGYVFEMSDLSDQKFIGPSNLGYVFKNFHQVTADYKDGVFNILFFPERIAHEITGSL